MTPHSRRPLGLDGMSFLRYVGVALGQPWPQVRQLLIEVNKR